MHTKIYLYYTCAMYKYTKTSLLCIVLIINHLNLSFYSVLTLLANMVTFLAVCSVLLKPTLLSAAL